MNHTLTVALIQNTGLLLAMVVVLEFLDDRQNLFAAPSRQALAGLAIGSIGIAMIKVSVPLEIGIIFERARCCSRSPDSSWGPGRRSLRWS